MPDSFDDRFSGLPVDAPSAPLISDIVGNAQIQSPQFNLVPVDYDPFPKKRKGPAAFNDEPPSEMIRPDAPVADKMFGLNGKERYQFFPERLARSVYDIMSGQVAPYNPSTGEYNVEGAMDVAGLLGGAPLGMKPGTATLGSGAMRKIYRGEYTGNKGGKYWTDDPEFARQFTQSGQENEVLKSMIDDAHIYKPKEPVYAGDPDAIDKVVATAKAEGFKAVELSEGHNQPNSVYVFDKAALRSDTQKPGMLIAANKQPAPAFFSAIEKAVTDISQPKMTGQQWLGTLSNKPGVKPEELDWIGLKDYLKENADKVVTKQEIQNHVEANKVELKDVDKGKYEPDKLDEKQYHKDLDRVAVKDFGRLYDHLVDSEQQQVRQAALERQNQNPTKYQSYQLPGGENYREKLLTIPTANDKYIKAVDDMKAKYGDKPLNQMPMTDAEKAYIDKQINAYGEDGGKYQSSHWDEPNVLAHVRMNDRTMQGEGFAVRNKTSGNTSQVFPTEEAAKAYAAKNFPDSYQSKFEYIPANRPVKSLHIEEIQSDWHQQGRQRGYKGEKPNSPSNFVDFAATKGITKDEAKRIWNETPNGDHPLLHEFQNNLDKYEEDTMNFRNAVPDAPFKKTWHELALKRMLREAAEKGYDRLSWTPGEAQAARYDLSKQIQQISFHTDEPGKGTLLAYGHNGETVFNKQITNAEKELPDIIGKEATQKLLEQKPKEKLGSTRKEQSLTGLELKIGGEGMKGFYDQIIPKALEKIGKEHGVKVKTTEIGVSGSKLKDGSYSKGKFEPIHYIDIPQSLKDQAMHRGFPLFSGGFMLNPVDHDPFKENK